MKFASNNDYFDWKFNQSVTPEEYRFMYPNGGNSFEIGRWASEDYRKNFIGDNWINAQITTGGSYKIIFDAHTERIKMLPK